MRYPTDQDFEEAGRHGQPPGDALEKALCRQGEEARQLYRQPYSAGRSVLQDWMHALSFMMQSVLICATRGPDGIRKDHPVKVLIRYLRRCFLICAFDGKVRWSPYEPGGGSFTGPLHLDHRTELDTNAPTSHLDKFVGIYLRHVDELPHHFQLHLMHAAEILGYKHPDGDVRGFWRTFYESIVNDAHLRPETEEEMDRRLGDNEAAWRAAELGEGHGVVALTPLPRASYPPPCHPGDKCERWPDCESCGPPRL